MTLDKIFSNRNTILISSLIFLVYLVYRIALIFYPTQDAGGVEGNVIYFIQRILDGQSFYSDPEKTPYAIAQYSPIYYYIVGAAAKLTGVGADDLLSLFAVNRTVSLLLNGGYIFIVFLIARNIFSLPARNAYVASVLSFIFLEITSYARPDSLNHFLFMATLYVFMLAIKREEEGGKSRGLLILSAILAATALFSKQTSFVLPVVIGIWLLMQKKYRQLFQFAGVYAVAVFLYLTVVHMVFGLPLFYKNVVLGINNGISISWFKSSVVDFFYLKFGMLFLCAFVALLFLVKKEMRPLLHFSKVALLLLFLLLNFVALKNGSNSGYLTEWWTLVIILAGFYGYKRYSGADQIGGTVLVAALWFILIAKPVSSANTVFSTVSRTGRTSALAHFKTQREFANKIKSRFSATDKYVLFLNIYTPDSYLCNLLFRNTITPQMDIVILASYSRRKYDYTDFEQALTDGRIKWMVMPATGPQKQFFYIRMDKFELADTEAGFNLYQYKP